MKRTIVKTAIILLATALMPATAMADLSKHEKETISKICKTAIAKKGYESYAYKYTEIMDVHSGGYSMTGQLHKDGKRFEYNCLLSKKGESLKITDLVIDQLGK